MVLRLMQSTVLIVLICASGALPLENSEFPGKIFWDDELEDAFKAPFTDQDRSSFVEKLHRLRVVSLENGCGRLKNRLVKLEDGTKVCCRYRDSKTDIRSDMYAYYFAGFLGIENIPPPVLAKVDFSSRLWSAVETEARAAGWVDGSHVVLAVYVEGLLNEYIPDVLRPTNALITKESLQNCSTTEKLRLMQWTDMISFDYVTGHTDRLFSSLLNLQWSPNMLQKPVTNLAVTPSGQLVLIDNESTFWLGYEVVRMTSSYQDLQKHFMQKICLFKRKTINSIEKLASSNSPWSVLEQYIKMRDPEPFVALGPLPPTDQADMAIRLRDVMARIHLCTNESLHQF